MKTTFLFVLVEFEGKLSVKFICNDFALFCSRTDGDLEKYVSFLLGKAFLRKFLNQVYKITEAN